MKAEIYQAVRAHYNFDGTASVEEPVEAMDELLPEDE